MGHQPEKDKAATRRTIEIMDARSRRQLTTPTTLSYMGREYELKGEIDE